MCGRFAKHFTWEQIHEFSHPLTRPEMMPNFEPRYNVCPTQTIDVVTQFEGESARSLSQMRWGLVPTWWKKSLKELPATFNARAETVAEKPMFRSAFKNKRCIIPASGYYEWTGEKGHRIPHYFTRRDGGLIGIAGLWDAWNPTGKPEDILLSCTMIIGPANEFVAPFHDRMPIILEREQFTDWLNAKSGTEVLKPAAKDLLQQRPVSTRVNSSRADTIDETLIEPITLH
ncbi:MAG: SOS response-associated peptidase [Xanthobacteraceae bacterium]|nr:SOS response-associated peptidase [Xanthobacteraceae bacterium]